MRKYGLLLDARRVACNHLLRLTLQVLEPNANVKRDVIRITDKSLSEDPQRCHRQLARVASKEAIR